MLTSDTPSHGYVPFRRIVPNMLTTVSLCSGLTSIAYSLKAAAMYNTASTLATASNTAIDPAKLVQIETLWKTAMLAIGVSAVFDMLDGRAARILRATSRFGAIYDSLSDFLAFGVAPAILVYQWMLKDHGALGVAAILMFVLCSALRLARFTAMPKQPKSKAAAYSKFFQGLPTPAAAGAMLVPPMLDVAKYFPMQKGRVSETALQVFDSVEPTLVIANSILIAALMISRVPMYSFKKVRIHRSLVVPLMVMFGLVVLALFRDAWLTVPIIVWCYLLSLPFSWTAHKKVTLDLRSATTV